MLVSTHSRPKAAGLRLAVNTIGSAVSTHSRPKAAVDNETDDREPSLARFQHTAARRRLSKTASVSILLIMFQHTAARRRLIMTRPKALRLSRFNTQPPEGGCSIPMATICTSCTFQHTAARRRLEAGYAVPPKGTVSTHSRPKAAVSFHVYKVVHLLFQHTAARRRLFWIRGGIIVVVLFQHTAARRRLRCRWQNSRAIMCFNTQPPEGGWPRIAKEAGEAWVSTHSRPKAAAKQTAQSKPKSRFQHTAARRRLALNQQIKDKGYCSFNTQPPEGGCYWM